MAELTDRDLEILRETHDSVIRLEALIGNGNDKGLCSDVRNLYRRQDKLNSRFLILVGTLVGSGILGGTTIGILKLLGSP